MKNSVVLRAIVWFAGWVAEEAKGSRLLRFIRLLVRSIIIEPLVRLDYMWRRFTKQIEEAERQSTLAKWVFSPIVYPLLTLAFIALSRVSLSWRGIVIICCGLIAFVMGCFMGLKLFPRRNPYEGLNRAVYHVSILVFTASAITAAYLLLRIGGIPALQPLVRKELYKHVSETYFAWSIIPAAIYVIGYIGQNSELKTSHKRVKATLVMLASLFIASLFGFRTGIVASFVGGIFCLYLTGVYRLIDISMWTLLATAVYSAVTAWRFEAFTPEVFLGLIFSRASITLHTYELIVRRVGFMGCTRGAVQYAAITSVIKFLPGPRFGPRTIVTNIIGGQTGTTTTCSLFGQMLIDFGIEGVVVEHLLLGALLGLMYKKIMRNRSYLAVATYSTYMGYLVPGIETGVLDFNVYVYLTLTALLFTASMILGDNERGLGFNLPIHGKIFEQRIIIPS